MNETPTSGPITSNITHQARDAISSRHSLPSSTKNGWNAERAELAEKNVLSACSACTAFCRSSGERKEDLFQVVGGGRPAACRGERRQFRQCSLAADAAAAQEHEPVADA